MLESTLILLNTKETLYDSLFGKRICKPKTDSWVMLPIKKVR